MANKRDCNLYYDLESQNFLVEYRGNFKEQISKVSYACGDIINNTTGVIALNPKDLDRLLKDVPAIIFVDPRRMFVLNDISPSYVDNINTIKINPYLNLTGRNVLVGIVDTGIDYLNEEFMREDGTSRILNIWDQTIQVNTDESVYIGQTYSNEQINAAITASRNNQDPYAIVPSRDEIGHGTKVAGIIGARGYNSDFKGIAHDSDFVIVKLFESNNYAKILEENRVSYTPVYNTTEIVAGLEYLRRIFLQSNRPMVIYLGVGTTDGSHDGLLLIARYLSSLGSLRGICLVSGVGNEGASQGHASGYIEAVGNTKSVDLRISREMKYLEFNIYVQKPNRASLNVFSPTGESSGVIQSKIGQNRYYKFVFTNTEMRVIYSTPDRFTGHEIIKVTFNNIKPGIWTFQLIGVYITNGRYDIWLPPKDTLPENTVFLEPDPFNTLTIPSTATDVITVSYFGEDNSLIAASGKGFNVDNVVNPDIATIGVNILTTQPSGGITTFSGSSAAAAIVAGVCALLLEWGIVKGNDSTMYSRKIRTYLMYGAYRNELYKFPNREIGYGDVDLLGTFNVISKAYRNFDTPNFRNTEDNDFIEYNINKLFIRIPRNNS